MEGKRRKLDHGEFEEPHGLVLPKSSFARIPTELIQEIAKLVLGDHDIFKPYRIPARAYGGLMSTVSESPNIKGLMKLWHTSKDMQKKVGYVFAKMFETVVMEMTVHHQQRLLELSRSPFERFVDVLFVHTPGPTNCRPDTDLLTAAFINLSNLKRIELVRDTQRKMPKANVSTHPTQIVHSILTAMAISQSKVENLILEPILDMNSPAWQERGVTSRALCIPSAQLRDLMHVKKLRICVGGNLGDPIAKLLAPMASLTELDLTGYPSSSRDIFSGLVTLKFPELKTVKLTSLRIKRDDLRLFISKNRTNLNKVHLQDITITQKSRGSYWAGAFKALRTCRNLSTLSLKGIKGVRDLDIKSKNEIADGISKVSTGHV